MKILEHDGPTGVQLQYHSKHFNGKYCIKKPLNEQSIHRSWTDDIENAFRMFDSTVKRANERLKPTLPAIDLDNPPEGLQTQTGRTVRVLGKADTACGTRYVVAIKNEPTGSYPDKEALFTATQNGQTIWGDEVRTGLTLTTGPVKKEGWLNIFANDRIGSGLFACKQDAIECGRTFAGDGLVATAKVTWEE